MIRIVAWNIRSGGGNRIPRILDEIARLAPDVLVVTEYRDGRTGDRLRQGLTDLGLPHQHDTGTGPRINSVLAASRSEMTSDPLEDLPNALRHRVVGVRLGELAVTGVYFAQRAEKRALFDWFLNARAGRFGDRNLLIGDFNTGRSDLDSESKRFHVEDGFLALQGVGWTDLWRREHGTRREYTWRSRTGNGFRIDHAFASESLIHDVEAVSYDHGVRRRRVSDHSALILTLTPVT